MITLESGFGDTHVTLRCASQALANALVQLGLPPPPQAYRHHKAFEAVELPEVSIGQSARMALDQLTRLVIEDCDHAVMLHGAAVYFAGRVVMIPGQSGQGKTTLASAMAAQGGTLITDELIRLDENHALQGFVRPIHARSAGISALHASGFAVALQLPTDEGHYIALPFADATQSHIADELLFVQWQPQVAARLDFVSEANALQALMAVNVNAANLPDHGFHQLAALCRSIPAARIVYSDLPSALALLRERVMPASVGASDQSA
ncbi:hypothetical protein OAS86_03480 [Gammaproteobacteria bacterium]|nr:hypothetical protein [Gammaproteobacteria bacterium]